MNLSSAPGLVIISLLVSSACAAQTSSVRLYGVATDEQAEEALRGYTVVATDTVDSTFHVDAVIHRVGDYELVLPYDRTYLVEVKAPGFIGKRVVVDMHEVPADVREAGLGMQVEFTLIAPYSDMDSALVQLPIGKAKYSDRKKNMVWDEVYSRDLGKRLKAEGTKRKK